MRPAAVAVVAGSLVAALAPGGWLLLRDEPVSSYGAAAAVRAAAPAAPVGAPPAVPAPAPAAKAPPEVPSRPAVATRPASLDAVVPRRDPPVEVRFAGLVAPVDPVGLDSARQVVVPDDVRRAGWWSLGPQPGDPSGAAVLVGHADSRSQGLGTFAGLRDLAAGAEVVVRSAAGVDLRYEVVSFERFAKTEVPVDRLFSSEGAHRLVLISCGGAFDPVRRTYEENVVVTAVPRA